MLLCRLHGATKSIINMSKDEIKIITLNLLTSKIKCDILTLNLTNSSILLGFGEGSHFSAHTIMERYSEISA